MVRLFPTPNQLVPYMADTGPCLLLPGSPRKGHWNFRAGCCISLNLEPRNLYGLRKEDPNSEHFADNPIKAGCARELNTVL
jgi:hypothetical protein